jgi:hypothetical protein
MTWTIREPRFEVRESHDGRWYWVLINDEEEAAQSFVPKMSKSEALDFVRWLRSPESATVPIMGDEGILEL